LKSHKITLTLIQDHLDKPKLQERRKFW